MKKAFVFLSMICASYGFAQDHFVGANTSSRAGILNGALNPAEFSNLSKKFEVNISGFSFNFSNDIVSLSDLNSDTDLEDLIFNGNSAVNASIDLEFSGLGAAMRWQKWAFALTTKGYVKADIIDVDPNLGDALLNSQSSIFDINAINTDHNQRVSGTSWGELGLSAARTVYEDDKHKFNGGITLKLLFPGSYSNIGVDAFKGTIRTDATGAYLSNANAALNFSYSGSLAESGTDFSDYTTKVFGGLHGFATDLGVNYQWKDPNDPKKYKINAGMSLRNIGTMTFSDSDNASDSYILKMLPGQELDLSEFQDAKSLKDIEKVLLNHPEFFTKTSSKEDFKVKLPTTFNIYADFKIYTKFFITGQLQQKMQDNSGNKQITAQNSWSIIPRVNLGFFEAYIPFSHSEFSGGNTGLGFRLGGFYMGSGSVVSALINDSKQIDFNMGFRWAFL
ncbi:DUF5723 family protein [Flavobacterium sp.]|uniref:DUF5723 family protein n=1 Tax=Flavobacterium sp. TaxID=239 RepID=UPI002609E4BD|nr:DUF5723 family protein [Flavobacterium sp.]